MKCLNCDQPATVFNHTQFAGKHYWCNQHIPIEDLADCVPIKLEDEVAPLSTQPPNPYTEARIQRLLDKLQEEAAEVIQAVSKIRRFGPQNHHPDRQETNLQELVGELEDFQAIQWALEEIKYLDPKPSITKTIKKFNQLMGS